MATDSKTRKHIARDYLRRNNFTTSENPVGIVTAGLPGAGKTEFTQQLLERMEDYPVRLDMDEIARLIDGYAPNIADDFRGDASIILSKVYDEVLKRKIHYVLDGTFAGSPAISNITRAIDKGYAIKLYFIHQQPQIAWEFTKAREQVEHRAIDKVKFIESYFRMYEKLIKLQSMDLPIAISVVTKNQFNQIGATKEDVKDIVQQVPPLLSRIDLENVLR